MNLGIRKIIEVVDEAVFPSNIYCICCGALIDGSRPYALCDECIRKFHWNTGRTCGKCGKALPDTYRGSLCYDCMQHNHYFTKGYSCLTYGLHEREVLMDFKYNGKGYIGRKFGDILYDRISCENLKIDVIIPVPISKGRMRKRGYNQSAVMARRLAQRMGVAYDERSLVRVRNTKMLRTLDPAERELALEGAFAVAGEFVAAGGSSTTVASDSVAEVAGCGSGSANYGSSSTNHGSSSSNHGSSSAAAGNRPAYFGNKSEGTRKVSAKLHGKRVLLIDDIMTTGATADACSKVLLEAGADSVLFLSLASGGNWKPERKA